MRGQIVTKELTLEEQLLQEKYKDKQQVDAIVDRILNEEQQNKERLELSKKQQFSNMVDSLWLKNQNLKKERELEQKALEDAVNFQRILDQRETSKLQQAQAANEFKDKV